jgi:hypothetical protein
MVCSHIHPGVAELHSRIVGIIAEVFFDIVSGIGTVKPVDRSVEISILDAFIGRMVFSHGRKGHQYNNKATQYLSHDLDLGHAIPEIPTFYLYRHFCLPMLYMSHDML